MPLFVTRPTRFSTLLLGERCNMKISTDRAAEAIEAAEIMFADEMDPTLDLSPAAKAALIATITAAIQAAVAGKRESAEQFVH